VSEKSRRSSASTVEEEGTQTKSDEEETQSDEEAQAEENQENVDSAAGPPTFATDGPALVDHDVSEIGTDRLEGERDPVIYPGESWVKLGDSEAIPEWAHGALAQVVQAPVMVVTDEETGTIHDENPAKAAYEVRERNQGATFFLAKEDFAEIYPHGRPGK
jgi:hypothetical protein